MKTSCVYDTIQEYIGQGSSNSFHTRDESYACDTMELFRLKYLSDKIWKNTSAPDSILQHTTDITVVVKGYVGLPRPSSVFHQVPLLTENQELPNLKPSSSVQQRQGCF